jgi:hypothetical protein
MVPLDRLPRIGQRVGTTSQSGAQHSAAHHGMDIFRRRIDESVEQRERFVIPP